MNHPINPLHKGHVHALGSKLGMSMILTMNLFERMQAGIFGGQPSPPRCLIDDMQIASGYCVDAPDEIPAGAMRSIPGDPEWESECWIGEQITVDREGGAA